MRAALARLRPGSDAVRAHLFRWRLRLGGLGLAAVAVALVALALAAAGMRGLEAERAEAARLAQALRAAPPAPPPAAAPAQRHEVLERLPALGRRHEDVGALMRLARSHDLVGARTQYRLLERSAAPVERLEVTVAATQGYEHWRAYLIGVLNELPNAAVTTAAWSRTNVDSERIDGRLVIVLHHRREP